MLERFPVLTAEGHQKICAQTFQPNTNRNAGKQKKYMKESTTLEINASGIDPTPVPYKALLQQ